MTTIEEAVEQYQEILAKIEKRVADPTTPKKDRQELLEIRAKMKIMGPTFLRVQEIRRLQAMFDKQSY